MCIRDRQLLTYLPPNNTEDPPHDMSVPIDEMEDQGIYDLIPGSSSDPLDMHAVIRRIVDNGQLFEVHANFAQNVIIGFARICGMVMPVFGGANRRRCDGFCNAGDVAGLRQRLAHPGGIEVAAQGDIVGQLHRIVAQRVARAGQAQRAGSGLGCCLEFWMISGLRPCWYCASSYNKNSNQVAQKKWFAHQVRGFGRLGAGV